MVAAHRGQPKTSLLPFRAANSTPDRAIGKNMTKASKWDFLYYRNLQVIRVTT